MDDDRIITLAAPTIFILVILIQFLPRYLDRQIKNGGGTSAEEKKLRDEIKQLLKEANSLSQPSTFAQAVKLRRTSAAKEKELSKCWCHTMANLVHSSEQAHLPKGHRIRLQATSCIMLPMVTSVRRILKSNLLANRII